MMSLIPDSNGEDSAPLWEVNHCHGTGRGHPCTARAGYFPIIGPKKRREIAAQLTSERERLATMGKPRTRLADATANVAAIVQHRKQVAAIFRKRRGSPALTAALTHVARMHPVRALGVYASPGWV